MPLGSMNHLSLTVSDRDASEPFYDAILTFMGYELTEKTDEFTLWWSASAGAVTIGSANPDARNPVHDRYSPGLHHFAFSADSREEVDRLHQLLVKIGATVLDAPAEYSQYAPGYYAVFFADPDGIKLELVHMPTVPE
ncbi:VOC family protein [Oculatella sp. LEGE 06141]|uniref:VOC family protein n=1 Tax=Oculatella sp. LEGE 06141 TaxID=1828648 RepID=UPI00188237AA|nr:VOC family protein [Oculatella sp. LEGE 06141]MBE9180488.1 VOC family protein [Oculatella sp. LEGE 06141]